jgi:hypothetical protein
VRVLPSTRRSLRKCTTVKLGRVSSAKHRPGDPQMPKLDDLAKLLSSVAAQDWSAAKSVGIRIAEAEEELGHHSAAQRLRGALEPNVGRSASIGNNGVALLDSGLLAAALTQLSSRICLADVVLRVSHRRELEALLAEWRHRDALTRRGLSLRRKLLFHGPPGCGKSLTAQALGNELQIPTFVVKIDAVVGAYLGQTALRIRELFKFAEHTACVLLLDEIDALGKRRGSAMDVGELDRVVISLMQELEHSTPRGIVVATSNVPQHLDDALYRRFDYVMKFPRPSRTELISFANRRAREGKLVQPASARKLVNGATNYADVARRVSDQERSTVLEQITRRK